MRQKLIELQGKTDKSIIVADFNTALSEMDRSSGQKIIKDIGEFNSTINKLNITCIYQLFHPTLAEYTLFPSSQGTFTKTAHILGHKLYFNKCKRTQIIQGLLLRQQWK